MSKGIGRVPSRGQIPYVKNNRTERGKRETATMETAMNDKTETIEDAFRCQRCKTHLLIRWTCFDIRVTEGGGDPRDWEMCHHCGFEFLETLTKFMGMGK